MLDFERTLEQLSDLTLLKYFPSDPGARLGLAKLVSRMAANEDQVEWLMQRTVALCNEWPGPQVFRQIFCSKFRPADGISVGMTEAFPEGPPSETGSMRCLAERALDTEPVALPEGHTETADAELDAALRGAAKQLGMRR